MPKKATAVVALYAEYLLQLNRFKHRNSNRSTGTTEADHDFTVNLAKMKHYFPILSASAFGMHDQRISSHTQQQQIDEFYSSFTILYKRFEMKI